MPELHGSAREAAAGALPAGVLPAGAVALAVVRFRPAPARVPVGPVPSRGRTFVRLQVVQAVLLGVGAGVINSRLREHQLVFARAAFVVGGHVLPLARVLGAPVLRPPGAVMVAVTAATAPPPPHLRRRAPPRGSGRHCTALPCFGCAGALWAAVLATVARACPSRG
ncbi:hypothetical protein AB0N09_33330 [Streptomyces erythrochromogenes]|uniref:hypothetical protein n=1 Tax=Streptomyces erythrochromogenes TaxID=285574 RepID=UPI0034401989